MQENILILFIEGKKMKTFLAQLFEDMQISNKLLRKVDWLAYKKAGEIMKKEE